MLDVVQLQTFATVIAAGSFSAAARGLHISQPAVSRQVALLERRLGVAVVVRDRAGVRPTPAGQLLLDHATAVIDRLTLAEAQVRAMVAGRTETVRLGSFFSALVHLSAAAAARIGEQQPGLRITDELVDRETAYARLGRGELDLAVVFDYAFAPAPVPDSLVVEPLFDDPVQVILPAGHRLADAAAIDPAELADETWIHPRDGALADLTDHVLARYGLDPARLRAGHGDEPVEVQALVTAGRGLTLTHGLAVILDPHEVVVRPLATTNTHRRVSAARPQGPLTPATELVLDALRDIGNQRQTR